MKTIQEEIIKKQDEYIKYLKQYLTAFEQVCFPVMIFEKEIANLKSRLEKEPVRDHLIKKYKDLVTRLKTGALTYNPAIVETLEKEIAELEDDNFVNLYSEDKEPEEIIKALSGEMIPDVKTVTSTDYKEPDGAEEILNQYPSFDFQQGIDSVKVFIKSDIIKAMHDFARQNLNKIIGQNESWLFIDVLKKLIEASNIFLHVKDYDGHGWEEISHCVKRGEEIIAYLSDKDKIKG